MPTVYLRKELYDKIIQNHQDPNLVVNEAVEDAIRKEPEVASK